MKDLAEKEVTKKVNLKRVAKINQKNFEEENCNIELGYYEHIEQRYLGQIDNIIQFGVYSDIYIGGARNVPSSDYLVFDLEKRKKLYWKDILEGGKNKNMAKLLKKEYLNKKSSFLNEEYIKKI